MARQPALEFPLAAKGRHDNAEKDGGDEGEADAAAALERWSTWAMGLVSSVEVFM